MIVCVDITESYEPNVNVYGWRNTFTVSWYHMDLYIYIYIYIYKFTLHVKYRKKTQTNKITRSPDTNIPESTWKYKITNNNNKYMCKRENIWLYSDLLVKRFM